MNDKSFKNSFDAGKSIYGEGMKSLSCIVDIQPSIKFGYMNIKPKSYFATPPSTRITSARPSTGNSLGPGKYKIIGNSPSPSFRFNRSPRFSGYKYPAANILFKKISDKERDQINIRISKNKDFAVLPSSVKINIAKEKAYKKTIKSEMTRIAKISIQKEIKQHKINLLKEKFQKFEYRMKINEVADIKKSWVILNTTFGVSHTLKKLLINRKKLRGRSIRLLIWLIQVSKCIGKLILKLRRRNYRSIIKLKIFFVPLIRAWFKKLRKKYQKKILYVIETKLSSGIMFGLLNKWISHIILIQRTLKTCLIYKKEFYNELLIKWNETEYNIFDSGPEKVDRRKQRTLSFRTTNEKDGISSIPAELKLHYIRKYIKQIISGFTYRLKKYKQEFNLVHTQNKKNKWIREHENLLDYPSPPVKPNIKEKISKDQINNFIHEALGSRQEWNNILIAQQSIQRLSYYK